ncbi:MAG: PAS domain-containing protein [Planctomycetota bacterium]
MIVPRVQPLREARKFGAEELFFSTTDTKGRIRYGNEVFTRVSGYSEEELVGEPHNIIRHPQVPRCVFKLLWNYLEAGKPIAAYVKNLAKDGRHYWVLAMITPCKEGYLSVRLKPSTPLFEAAKELYARVLEEEQLVEARTNKREAIEKATPIMLQGLAEAGFPDYDAFMRAALCEELNALRPKIAAVRGTRVECDETACLVRLRGCSGELVDTIEGLFQSLSRFHTLGDRLFERHAALDELGKSLTFSSLNANLAASRMGAAGATLSVISRSLGERSKEADQMLGDLMSRMGPLCSEARRLAFDVAVAQLQAYVSESYATELRGDAFAANPAGVREGLECLSEELLTRSRSVMNGLGGLYSDIRALGASSEEVSKQVERMQVVQLNGRIEVAAQTQAGAFTGIFDDIGKIIEESRGDCLAVTEMLDTAAQQITQLVKIQPKLAEQLDQLSAVVADAVSLSEEQIDDTRELVEV